MVILIAAPLLVPLAGPGPPLPGSPLVLTDLQPSGGESFAGGTSINVSWNATHDNATWTWASLSYTLGGDGFFISAGEFSASNATQAWQLPRFNSTEARVRLCAAAPDGDRACIESSGNFTITATPPYFDLLSPSNHSGNVSLGASLALGMEGVDAASVSWTITPAVALTPMWSPDFRFLYLSPTTPFRACSAYTVTATADLGGTPGNFWWMFTTTCPSRLTNLSVGASILLEFTKAIDPTSMTWLITPSLTLTPVWRLNNTMLDLYPTPPFAPCTSYTIVFDGGGDFDGNPLLAGPFPNPLSWSTSCGPYIVSTDPADADMGVWFFDPVVIQFSEPLNLTKPFELRFDPPAFGMYSWSAGNTVLTFYASPPFYGCAKYTATVVHPDLIPGPVPNPWRFMTACVPPVITGIRKVAADTVRLEWWQEWTSPDIYRIYDSPDRFASWPWRLLGEVPAVGWRFDAVGHLTDGETHFYTVVGVYGTIEARSQMVVKVELDLGFDESTTNLYHVGLPYRSQFEPPLHASDVVPDFVNPPFVDILGTWDPATGARPYYFHFRGAWRGADFAIYPGQGLWLGTTRPSRWAIVGMDANVQLNFTAGREYWISLPYTSPYQTVSNLVLELEGSLNGSANSRIVEAAHWDAATQSLRIYSWTPSGWAGTDFGLAPGDALRLRVVGGFTWNPRLMGAP